MLRILDTKRDSLLALSVAFKVDVHHRGRKDWNTTRKSTDIQEEGRGLESLWLLCNGMVKVPVLAQVVDSRELTLPLLRTGRGCSVDC